MERVTQFNFLGVMFIRTWIGADILIAFLGNFQGQLLSIYCIGSKIYIPSLFFLHYTIL